MAILGAAAGLPASPQSSPTPTRSFSWSIPAAGHRSQHAVCRRALDAAKGEALLCGPAGPGFRAHLPPPLCLPPKARVHPVSWGLVQRGAPVASATSSDKRSPAAVRTRDTALANERAQRPACATQRAGAQPDPVLVVSARVCKGPAVRAAEWRLQVPGRRHTPPTFTSSPCARGRHVHQVECRVDANGFKFGCNKNNYYQCCCCCCCCCC